MTNSITNPVHTYALVVGIEKYALGSEADLHGPAHDAYSFAAWLAARGVPQENVVLLLSPLDESNHLLDEWSGPYKWPATREKVDFVINQMVRQWMGDLFYVYWAGHEIITATRSRRLLYADTTKGDWHHLVLDSLLIYMGSHYLSGFQQQICIVDTCANYNEQMLQESLGDNFPTGKPVTHREQFVFFATSPSRMAKNLSKEPSGIFSKSVLEELAKEPDTNWPPDMAGVAERVKKDIDILAKAGVTRQTPISVLYRTWDGTERPLVQLQKEAIDLPSGTVTLLFTDIEGSTLLLQHLGDQYVLLLTECRYLLRSAFHRWNGHEVDTQGDAFFVAFANTSDAVSAAIMAQHLLFTHTWPEGVAVRVRMGIHTGEPVLVSEGYIGMDVHRAARIMSAGHGGQVLLSQRSHDLVEQTLPSQVSLKDVGEHYLKDLPHPEHLFQLVISDLPADFPPPRSLNFSPTASTTVSKLAESTHAGKVYALAWSPDRRFIASGSQDRTVKVWKSTTRLTATTYGGHVRSITTLAWSPDGRYIASASLDKTVQVWSALPNDGAPVERKLSSYESHSGMICAIAWSPDGRRIASTSTGGTETTVHIWEVSTGRTLLIYKGHPYWVRAIAWSPDGKFIASGSLREVQVWDVTTGRKAFIYRGHEGWVRAIKWSPDGSSSFHGQGSHIASTSEDKTVQVWSPHNDHALVTYRGHTELIDIVAWSPNGTRIVSVSKDNVVWAWDAETGDNTLTFHCHADSTHAVAWLPDGKHLASVNGDGVIQVWKGV